MLLELGSPPPLLAIGDTYSGSTAAEFTVSFRRPTLKSLRLRLPGAAMEEGGKMKAIWQLLSMII
jgi:hypothetical protein